MQIKSQPPTILITAGPTREALDPVRYISNHSTGKMGYAIAEAFLNMGFYVVLVSGPVQVELIHPRLTLLKVESGNEMYEACKRYSDTAAIMIFTAAVADYKPAVKSNQKIKKHEYEFNLKMVRNVDIAFELSTSRKDNQVSVGFALETNDEEENAQNKMLKKNFDLIVLNSTNDKGAGFGYDTNDVTIIDRNFQKHKSGLKMKSEIAVIIAEAAISCLKMDYLLLSQ